MIKRSAIANMVLSAQQDGATHLFVARNQLDPDWYYGVRVMPGQDPREVHDQSDNWMLECYSLQDPALPVREQLAEGRAWHMDPGVEERPAESPASPELVALQGVVARYKEVRSLTFSPSNRQANYDRFEAARSELYAATRTAYEEKALTPFQIRRTTGLSGAQVGAATAPTAEGPVAPALSPAAMEARSAAGLGTQERSVSRPEESTARVLPWWSQPVHQERVVAGLD